MVSTHRGLELTLGHALDLFAKSGDEARIRHEMLIVFTDVAPWHGKTQRASRNQFCDQVIIADENEGEGKELGLHFFKEKTIYTQPTQNLWARTTKR